MKINELEKALGIPRASVRYYEKEGLMSPHRHDNGYRDYDDNDVKTLKTIIVLRKMGLSVDQIKQVLSGRVGLNAAVEKNTAFLQDQIESLNGAIRMCNEVLKSDMSIDSFDTETYWRRLTEGEKNGEAFASIANDLVDFESRIILGCDADSDMPVLRKLLNIVLFIGAVAVLYCVVADRLFGRGTASLSEILSVYAAVTVIFAGVFFVRRRNEKAGDMLMKGLGVASAVFLLLLICLVIVLLLNAKAHFLF